MWSSDSCDIREGEEAPEVHFRHQGSKKKTGSKYVRSLVLCRLLIDVMDNALGMGDSFLGTEEEKYGRDSGRGL